MEERPQVEHILLGDRIGVSLFVGEAQPVKPQVDHRLMNSRILANTDRGTGRHPGQGKEHGGHDEQEEDSNGDPADDIEGHATIL